MLPTSYSYNETQEVDLNSPRTIQGPNLHGLVEYSCQILIRAVVVIGNDYFREYGPASQEAIFLTLSTGMYSTIF